MGEEDSFSQNSRNAKAILIGGIFWLLDNIQGIKRVTLPPPFWHPMGLKQVIVKLIKTEYRGNSRVYHPTTTIF